MTNGKYNQVAVVRDFGDIQPKRGSDSPRYIIEELLKDPKCFAEVKPYFLNGGVCGHKVMDIKGAVDIIRKYDNKFNAEGGGLKSFPDLKDYHIGNKLKTVMRSKYLLNKYWKIEGENDKRVLPAPKQQEEETTASE